MVTDYKKRVLSILFAVLAAVFYSLSIPVSKILLESVAPTFMASFLYLGAGAGVGIMYVFSFRREKREERLTSHDLPYTVGMIVLDILAPVFLMIGIDTGSASNASLLGNFEIVATALIALILFGERVSMKLWIAIALISVSSIILSFEGSDSLRFSVGSLFVILATLCWGLENNCTRKIADRSTYEIVVLKGIFSGGGAFLIAVIRGEQLPEIRFVIYSMILGFIAYGLSIFLYIRAQRELGAAKTSAYYAIAPFIGAFLSFVLDKERPSLMYFAALAVMLAGSVFVVRDTLSKKE